MSVINIKKLSKVLEDSPKSRKLFKDAIQIILAALEGQKLLDSRKLQKLTLDWEKGTLNLGEGTINQIIGRSLGEYYLKRKSRALFYAMDQLAKKKES